MAKQNEFQTDTIAAEFTRDELLTWLHMREDEGIYEFNHMAPHPSDAKKNIVYFRSYPDLATLNPLVLEAIPPDADKDEAGKWMDTLIGQGLRPLRFFQHVRVSDKEVSLLPCRTGPAPILPTDFTPWIATRAALFGLNIDGSDDQAVPADGVEALGKVDLHDVSLLGCALPLAVVRSKFNSLKGAKEKQATVRKKGDPGPGIKVRIVDLGPSEGQLVRGCGIALTLAAVRQLGGQDSMEVEYQL